MRFLESSKSAIVGVAWAVVVKYIEFLPDEMAWDIFAIFQPEILEQFVSEVKYWLLAGGGAGAWWRSRNPVDKGFDAPVVAQEPLRPIQAPAVLPAPEKVIKAPASPNRTYAWRLSKRSETNLSTVHADLQRLTRLALTYSPVDFGVTEGIRELDRQRKLMAEGKSWTLNSRHLHGLAVDVAAWVDGRITWDFAAYEQINSAFARAALELGIRYQWGGEWKTKDGVHFELSRDTYPDTTDVELPIAV